MLLSFVKSYHILLKKKLLQDKLELKSRSENRVTAELEKKDDVDEIYAVTSEIINQAI